MKRTLFWGAVLTAGCLVAPFARIYAQVNPPAPIFTNPPPTPAASLSPAPGGLPTPIAPPSGPVPSPSLTPTPTPPPIVVQPQAAQIPVGAQQSIRVGSVLGQITVKVADPAIVDAIIDQQALTITLTGKAPGATSMLITDQRGVSASVPVRVAYLAGSVAPSTSISITGDPAGADFVKQAALKAALAAVQSRPGAQVVATADEITYNGSLAQDDIATITVPVLIQGEQYFTVDSSTRVRVENVAVPKIVPDSLMVSDYPERLTENGLLFASDLKRSQPSRFLYFHYNPPGQPDRRIVLRAQNTSPEPATVQFISGQGGPDPNEMLTGHVATYKFLRNLVQNQGQVIVIPANGTLNLVEQLLPAKMVVCNLLQSARPER